MSVMMQQIDYIGANVRHRPNENQKIMNSDPETDGEMLRSF
jgi:hypothetical protein